MDHHPEVCIFGEFEFAVRWIDGQGYPPRAKYYRQLELDRAFRAQQLTIDESLDYEELVRSFLGQACARSGKPIAGATVHSNFHELLRIWPEARFIHLVRDPRDVSRSCIGMGWVGNAYHGTPYWIEPVRRWQAFEPQLRAEQKHQLRYEDLIRQPHEELAKICEFLGISVSEKMLDYPNDTTYAKPDPSLTEQWRTKLSTQEVSWVESRCKPWMQVHGYSLDTTAEPPNAMESMQLAWHNRWSRVQSNVGVYGLPLYLSWQLAKRMPYNPMQKRILRRVDDIRKSRLK
jgi:hypothetical protein